MSRSISAQEVMKHNIPEDVWIVVDGTVYDMTEFAPEHPGGAAIILRYAGRDATQAYSEIHAPSIIQKGLPASKTIGRLDTSTITEEWAKPPLGVTTTLKPDEKPPLDTLINTHDFREVAERTLSKKAWNFYSSAATDLNTLARNKSAYTDIGLRPRVLIDVHEVDTTTTMLGLNLSVPIFCSPAALAKLCHPDGEKAIGRGCKRVGIPQSVSTNASFPIDEIFEASRKGPYGPGPEDRGDEPAAMFFQLYVDKNRKNSEELLKKAERLGAKAILLTVDAPIPGKREADERLKADENMMVPNSGAKAKNDKKGGGLGRVMSHYIDSSVSWKDIAWLKSCVNIPIVLKGIQSAMDAVLAMEHGIQGIILSNHGGRSLDTAPPAILVLLELQKCCPQVFDKMEIFVDGGIERGTDIFKALCLGAKAVGMGRGFLYAVNYGEEGIERYIEILKDELETTMKMCGVTDLSQVHPGLLNTLAVDHLIPSSGEHPYAKWRPKPRL